MSVESNKYEPTACPRCGEPFTCTQKANCWCFLVDIPQKVGKYLENNVEGCVCEKCLCELEKII